MAVRQSAGRPHCGTMEGFSAYFPLAQAEFRAPEAPGVVQLRIEKGLIAYPRGKSAMVRYASADDVRAWLIAHRDALTAAPLPASLLFRVWVTPDHQARLKDLRQRFLTRFGALPRLDEASLRSSAVAGEPVDGGSPDR